MQLHNYVFFVPSIPRRKKKLSEQIQMGMPVVPEEAGFLSDLMEIQKASSLSDAASGNIMILSKQWDLALWDVMNSP